MNVEFVFETRTGRVTDYRLPNAAFGSRAAYDELADVRRLYEEALTKYKSAIAPAVTRKAVKYLRRTYGIVVSKKSLVRNAQESLREDMLSLGYDEDQIQWQFDNPNMRLAEQFGI